MPNMQILQWLFNLAREEGISNSSTTTHETTLTDRKTSRGSKRGRQTSRRFRRRGFWIWCRRDVEVACFYSTLSLRRLGLSGSESRRRRWEELFRSIAKMKQQQQQQDQIVSRRFDPATSENVAANVDDSCSSTKQRRNKKEEMTKAKATISRMKELIRWASASKSDKAANFISPKILELRRRSTPWRRQVKEESEEVRSMSECPKMSLRWESEMMMSCSTDLSSIYTDFSEVSVASTPRHHFPHPRGHWITTDSEFVVLEL